MKTLIAEYKNIRIYNDNKVRYLVVTDKAWKECVYHIHIFPDWHDGVSLANVIRVIPMLTDNNELDKAKSYVETICDKYIECIPDKICFGKEGLAKWVNSSVREKKGL